MVEAVFERMAVHDLNTHSGLNGRRDDGAALELPDDLNPARRRILVVEDEALVAMQLEDMLGELGHEVAASCARLDEAVATAQTVACDMAVLDINLAGQKSFPVAEALKSRGAPFLRDRLRRFRPAAGLRRHADPAQALQLR